MTNDRYGLRSAFIAIAVIAGMANAAKSQSYDQLKSEFRNPAKQFRPMVRWWWPGGDVDDKEIQREIDLLDKAEFGGAEIQSFVTFDTRSMPKDQVDRIRNFATPSYFAHVRAAVDDAKSRGMWIDDTLGSCWPFGGGLAITPELSAIELRSEDTVVEGSQLFSGKLKIPQWTPGLFASLALQAGGKPEWPAGWEERFQARSKIIAVVAMRAADPSHESNGQKSESNTELLDRDSAVVLTDRMQADGSLEWQVPAGKWHIFVYRQIPTRQPIPCAADTGPQLVLDHLNKEAFAAHAHRLGDPLVAAAGRSGTSLRAIFCDSLELQEYVFWTDDFLDQFKKRRGYDLTPYLAILRQSGYNDFYFSHPGGRPLYDVTEGGDSIRSDYWKTVSELIDEGFYQPFDQWAKLHNLKSRVQAHGAPADLLKLYGQASIPETEQLAGNNTVNFMKLASSAGYDYGRPIVSSESFVFAGNPYITTPESIKANSDKMFVAGVNEIVYHGFPYKYDDGTKGIGWYPFQGEFSSQINEANPIWPFIGTVNEYITRLQYVMQTGTSELQVAIFRSALNEDDTGPTLSTGPVKDPFPGLEERLTAAGYSFGFVNEDSLIKADLRNGRLRTNGGGVYQALVIPRETRVSAPVIEKLNAFSAGKLPIIFVGGMPEANVSFRNLQRDTALVNSGLNELGRSTLVIQAADSIDATSRLSTAVSPQLRFTNGAVFPFVKKVIGQTHFYFFSNPTNNAAKTSVEFEETSAPELWDPWTGKSTSAPFRRNGGHAVLELSLPPYGSAICAFDPSRHYVRDVPPESISELKSEKVGKDGWIVTAKGNSERGVGIEERVKLEKLIDWRDIPELRTFSGTATYVTHLSVESADLNHADKVILDLGDVRDAAMIKINGSAAGELVAHPFAIDIRPLLKPGDNAIEVTVANSLTNYASTIQWPKRSEAFPIAHFPPLASGLLGPVMLKFEMSQM